MLPRHARCVLSRLRCKGHSLFLGSYLSRIGRIENHSCSVCGTRPRTPLISFCTVQLRTLCTAHSLATLCLFTTSGPDPGEFPGFWGFMVFRHAPIRRKGSGKQQQSQSKGIVTLLSSTTLRESFVKYNTAMPFSAAVERLFSFGKDVLKPKRSGLSDEHFEMLVFLK